MKKTEMRKRSSKMTFKKLIKCFIPYGFLALRRKLKEEIPLNLKIGIIENNFQNNYLSNVEIMNFTNGGEGGNIISINREDYKYPIYLRNYTTDVSTYKEIIEMHEYCFTAKHEPKYIIDAGANVGMAAIYFANKYKNAKIIAIEPESENYELLKKNTENYTNITVIQAALWDTSGEISLFDMGLGDNAFMAGTSKTVLKTPVKNIKQMIKTVTIDEIINEFHIDVIDILKIDIEGSEKEVFESCKSWINKTKCIIIELHERMKRGCNKAFYKTIKYFEKIGSYGEDIYLSRDDYIKIL
jgi:FkbM family methyltransferase